MPRTSSNTSKRAGAAQEPAWSIPSLREPRYSQSLERGLAILCCFTPARPVMGIADIADALDMSRSTTHRYVITLVALGYLEQGASRKYRLGLRVTDLGMSVLSSTGLREHSHSYLEELRQRTSYTSNLSVLDGEDIVYIDRARSFRRGQSRIDLGLHPGVAAAGALHLDGQGPARRTARRRAGRPAVGDAADQARPEHDHEPQGAARAATDEVARGGPRRERRGARPGAALDRRRPCATNRARSSPPSTSRRTPR